MTKIAFTINYIIQNGPGNVVLNIIHNLDRQQYDISLITLFSGNDKLVVEQLKKEGVHVYECASLSRKGCVTGRDQEFQQLIKDGNFDIIHSHGFIPDILSSRLKVPAQKITTLHCNMFEDYVQTYGRLKAKIYIRMQLKALKKLDCCVCCSKSVYEVMKRYLKNAAYIRNGIQKRVAKQRLKRSVLNIPEDATVFIFSGGLSPRKNVLNLVHDFIAYRNDDEYLLILGDGSERAACEKALDDHVKMLGFQDDPAAFYNISDIYVSASRSEGFSISVLEALSCGLGLFLSDIPSHREVVEMGTDAIYLGETFDISDDGTGFKRSLEKLRSRYGEVDKAEIQRFQAEKLSDRVMTKHYDQIYQKI